MFWDYALSRELEMTVDMINNRINEMIKFYETR